MASQSPHQRYVGLLLERVRSEKYPSGEDLDRIERFITTPDEAQEYLDYLFDQVEGSRFPSPRIKGRLERILALTRG